VQALDIGKVQTFNIEKRYFGRVLRNLIAHFIAGTGEMDGMKQRT